MLDSLSCLLFQSTPPARGATAWFCYLFTVASYFNPRPPRGGRPKHGYQHICLFDFNPRPPRGGRLYCIQQKCGGKHISIHAPREGGDHSRGAGSRNAGEFQSTPPARGATTSSIRGHHKQNDFNPRPPRGGRRYTTPQYLKAMLFQSTPPARGAT